MVGRPDGRGQLRVPVRFLPVHAADELTAVQLLTDDFKVLIDEDGIDPFINPLTGTRENMPESYGDNTRAALEATFGVTI